MYDSTADISSVLHLSTTLFIGEGAIMCNLLLTHYVGTGSFPPYMLIIILTTTSSNTMNAHVATGACWLPAPDSGDFTLPLPA